MLQICFTEVMFEVWSCIKCKDTLCIIKIYDLETANFKVDQEQTWKPDESKGLSWDLLEDSHLRPLLPSGFPVCSVALNCTKLYHHLIGQGSCQWSLHIKKSFHAIDTSLNTPSSPHYVVHFITKLRWDSFLQKAFIYLFLIFKLKWQLQLTIMLSKFQWADVFLCLHIPTPQMVYDVCVHHFVCVWLLKYLTNLTNDLF